MKKILVGLMMALLAVTSVQAGVIAQDPLFISSQADPRVMLVVSRDHQLFIKAYTDYSDLNGDGYLDTTFTSYIEYDGYFNPRKCYTYSSNRFEAAAAATTESISVTLGTSTVTKSRYVCGGTTWSGNLLNWASMTRMDVVRKVFYGGYRSTDTESETVLERAYLPVDVHAFAKVFSAGSQSEMNKFTPYNVAGRDTISFCNVTLDETNNTSKNSIVAPTIRVAHGAYPRWDAGEVVQCKTGAATQPAAVLSDFNARVKVCDDAGGTDPIDPKFGPKCKTYLKSGTAKKPIGLIQQYADVDAFQSLRFGLLSGSWAKNKSGGVLRRNVGQLTNNRGNYPNSHDCSVANSGNDSATTKKDEIDFCTGVFVNNQGKARSAAAADDLPSSGGVIGTLNRFRISDYKMNDHKYQSSCNSPGLLTFSNGQCVDWGNPLSEMYLETLRYFRAGNGTLPANPETATFKSTTESSYITGLPTVAWSDPIPSTDWCAKSNIVMVSTGLNSFDTDETANTDLAWAKDTPTLTNEVADSSHENLSGSYMIGSATVASTSASTCTAKSGSFANFSGVCPEVPSLAGSYHIAGLALGASQYDLRPGYKTLRQKLNNAAVTDRQPLSTFTVALAENLPDFDIPVGSSSIKILPACQAQDGALGFRTCSMTNLVVEAGTTPAAGSLLINWEDSSWGNDYDMDGIAHIRYCVGNGASDATNPCWTYRSANGMPAVPEADTLYLKAAAMQANAGHQLQFGYTVTGSTSDGVSYPIDRPGGANSNYLVGNEFTRPLATWTSPTWVAFIPGTSTAKLLKNPLWYTAKYAAWNATPPNWDQDLNGVPDNFYEVRNPAGLDDAISAAFNASLAGNSSSSSIATNSTRLDAETYVYQARFNATGWSGQVQAYALDTTGHVSTTAAWDAGAYAKFPIETGTTPGTDSKRKIFTYNRSASAGVDFRWASLSAKQKAGLDNANAANSSSPYLTYLRGNQSEELRDTNGDEAYDTGIYRPRISMTKVPKPPVNLLMGDIINSDPVFVGSQDLLYRTITSIPGYGTYGAHVSKKLDSSRSTKNPMIVVNANDGMMHAIDARNGNEIFTYVPSWLICADETGATGCTSGANSSPLRNLLDPNMTHRYILDGSLVAGDAYIGSTPSWKTVVVGAAAAGGKGIFALDVTKSFDGASATAASSSVTATQTAYLAMTAANTVMWEFTDKDYLASTPQNGDVDLGYTYGLPVIARMKNGDWAAIFGNGYGSANGKAILYVVNLDDGTLIRKIDVGDGSTSVSPNGLSSPAVVFDQGTGAVKVIFAGDLKGNLWKFDVSSTSPASWDVDNGTGVPLFTAFDDTGNRQPITGGLDIGAHPSGGYMVYFGTGKYFEKNDNTTTTQQTIYGIWDKTATTDAIPAASVDTAAEKGGTVSAGIQTGGVLQQRKILEKIPNPYDATKFSYITDRMNDYLTGAEIDWTARRGWYMNLQVNGVAAGERLVTPPILRNKRVIYTTMIPSTAACAFGGDSHVIEVDPLSGDRPLEPVFDLNGDGQFTDADKVMVWINGVQKSVAVSSVQSTEGIIKTPAIIAAGGKEYKIGSGTTGNILVISEKGATARPRPAWRQLQ
jgi:type IV pilus assembly protein PilY1